MVHHIQQRLESTVMYKTFDIAVPFLPDKWMSFAGVMG